jgi:hypothetical protein
MYEKTFTFRIARGHSHLEFYIADFGLNSNLNTDDSQIWIKNAAARSR